jgi:Protein of unknown function (DUF3467)
MKKPDSESEQPSVSRGPARMMSNQMGIYYSNCAMVATSPRDISLFFGRYTPVPDDKGGQTLGELYERQIYMTIEQAEDLAKMLARTLEAFRSRRQGPGASPEESR